MASVTGPILRTPLSRGGHRPAVPARIVDHPGPADGDWFLGTREGHVALRRRADGALDLDLRSEPPQAGRARTIARVGSRDGRAIWSTELAAPGALPPDAAASDAGEDVAGELLPLRSVAEELAEEAVDPALAAVALAAWQESTRFCAACGAELRPIRAGWSLRCQAEGREHFPRTDPAVIMAVRDESDRLLLAQPAHGRFHSVLAGFVEAGESAESAVVREVAEEVSVEIGAVEYVGSQPWPFPRSLMLGFRAWSVGSTSLTLQEEEIAQASWFTREELAAALSTGAVLLPGQASLGRALIRDWFGRALPDEPAGR